MAKIHAAIYSQGSQAWLSMADWGDAAAGIERLDARRDDAALVDLAEFAEGRLADGVPGHELLPAGARLEPVRQTPRLVLFRFGEDAALWVARGFLSWGAVEGVDDEIRLRLLVSESEDETADAYRLAKVAARFLYQLRSVQQGPDDLEEIDALGGASQTELDRVPLVEVDASLAFADDTALADENVPGGAQDFGNAQHQDE